MKTRMSRDLWNVIDAERGVLWCEYEFREGAYATTFVFRGVDGLVVVSPGGGLAPEVLDALAEYGEVKALVANNAFHHVGQAAWRRRFPQAHSYAGRGALARLQKKTGVAFRPIDELALPGHVHVEELPGFKQGELLLRVGTARGSVWYTGDLLTNIQRTPGPPFRWLFTLTGSAPGFRLFRPAVWMFVKDKQALRERMQALLAEVPPAVVVPAHGPAVYSPDVAAEARAQIDRL